MEYFEGLTYEHVNFIFDGASHVQVPFLRFTLSSNMVAWFIVINNFFP